jgi:uncharacterized protein involved in copper resistance
MKTLTKIAIIVIPALALSLSANAHDPSMHVKKAEKANCSKMDHSKMDTKDPVAMAMMKKCMKQAEQAKMDHSKMGHDDKNAKVTKANKDGDHSDH